MAVLLKGKFLPEEEIYYFEYLDFNRLYLVDHFRPVLLESLENGSWQWTGHWQHFFNCFLTVLHRTGVCNRPHGKYRNVVQHQIGIKGTAHHGISIGKSSGSFTGKQIPLKTVICRLHQGRIRVQIPVLCTAHNSARLKLCYYRHLTKNYWDRVPIQMRICLVWHPILAKTDQESEP